MKQISKYINTYIAFIIYIFIQNIDIRQSICSFLPNVAVAKISKNIRHKIAYIFLPEVISEQYYKSYSSQEVIIYGINNNLIRNRLKKFLDIHQQISLPINKIQLHYWINQLKLSGFFQEVSSKVLFYNQKQIIIINIKINPIIKQISIFESSQKIIPHSLVTFYFRYQLGYPKNFYYITNSLKKIHKWYYVRGYHLAEIQIDNSTTISETIIAVVIKEGILSKIELIGYTETTKFININNIISASFLLNSLNIKLHQSINILYLELGLTQLKHEKIFVECNYKLICNNHYKNTWSLTLRCKLPYNKSSVLLNNRTILPYFICLCDSILEYSHKRLAYNPTQLYRYTHWLSNRARIFLNRYNILITEQINDNLFFNIPLNHNLANICKKFLNVYKIFLHTDIMYYVFWIYFQVDRQISLKYYTPNRVNQAFTFNAKLIDTITKICINYKNSWTSLSKPIKYDRINICYFHAYFIYYTNSLPIIIYPQFNDYLFYQMINIQTKLSYKLSTVYQFIKEIYVKTFINPYSLLYNYLLWPKNKVNFQYIYSNNFNTNFKILHGYQINHLLSFSISYIYNRLHKFTYKISAKNISLEYKFLKSNNIFSHNNSISHKLEINIKKYYVICKQLIIYKLQLTKFFNFSSCLHLNHIHHTINCQTVRSYKHQIFMIPSYLATATFEYHIPVKYKHTIFGFIDYQQYLNNTIQAINNSYISIPYNILYFDNYRHLKVGCGIGIQFIMPVKRTLFLNIEYGWNIHHETCLHIRINQATDY